MAETENGTVLITSDTPQQKRRRLISKALDLSKQLEGFTEEEQVLILDELAFILCLDEQKHE